MKSTRDGKQVRRRGRLPGPQLLLVPNHTARPGAGPPGCQARGSRSPPGHELIEHAEPGLRPPGPGPRPVFSAGPKRAPLKCVVPRSFDHFLKSRRHKVAKTDFERLVESAVTNLQVPRPASGCALRQLQSAAKRRCWGQGGGGPGPVTQALPGLPPTPRGSDRVWGAREARALDLRTPGAGLWLVPLDLSECRPAGGHAGQRAVPCALCTPVRPTLHLATGLTGGRSLPMAFLRHLGQVLPAHADPPRDTTVPTLTCPSMLGTKGGWTSWHMSPPCGPFHFT